MAWLFLFSTFDFVPSRKIYPKKNLTEVQNDLPNQEVGK